MYAYGMFLFVIFPIWGVARIVLGGALGPSWASRGPHGPGPNGRFWALIGQALMSSMGPNRPHWAP